MYNLGYDEYSSRTLLTVPMVFVTGATEIDPSWAEVLIRCFSLSYWFCMEIWMLKAFLQESGSLFVWLNFFKFVFLRHGLLLEEHN